MIGSIRPVVANVIESAAKAERVGTVGIAQVLIDLNDVLGSAEGAAVAGREGIIAGESNVIRADGHGSGGGNIHRRDEAAAGDSLLQISKTVEHHLAL